MEGGPPRFRQGSTCLVLLGIHLASSRFRLPGCHRLWPLFPKGSTSVPTTYRCPTTPADRNLRVWADPLSLATTKGVSFDFLSWTYLDVSVQSVGPLAGHRPLCLWGCPIRISPDQSLVSGSPKLFAAFPRPSSPPIVTGKQIGRAHV